MEGARPEGGETGVEDDEVLQVAGELTQFAHIRLQHVGHSASQEAVVRIAARLKGKRPYSY